MKHLFVALCALFLAWMVSANEAAACNQVTAENCGPVVPDMQYQGGGVKVKVVKATACFDLENRYGERYVLDAISGTRGPFPYTADFVYNPQKGTHEVIKTVKNGSPCWTHNVAVGTWMAVYVTCETYTGWVAVKVTAPGTYVMRMVPWPFAEKIS